MTRGADGVVYDPDQYDADANQRSGGDVVPRPSGGSARQTGGSNTVDPRFALLFDCDGVIVETGTIVPPPPSLLDERTRIEP